MLAPAHLENAHLLAATVRQHGGLDLGAGHERRADAHRVAFADCQDLVKGHCRADVRSERLDAHLLA